MSGPGDQRILDWCKLFVERDGKHCWRIIVSNPISFEAALHRHIQFDARQLDELFRKMRHSRDKFVAHLDAETTMDIPELESS